VLLALAGVALLGMGFQTIGFDGAGFLYEYKAHATPLKRRSIYAFIRHPLFLGGVLASVGASLLSSESIALAMAAINVLILPVYAFLEDARLTRVFGTTYHSYRMHVGGMMPKRGVFRKSREPAGANASWGHPESN
jgi:protein-S-isoprenylcysteine O-methyltransferase Ste14